MSSIGYSWRDMERRTFLPLLALPLLIATCSPVYGAPPGDIRTEQNRAEWDGEVMGRFYEVGAEGRIAEHSLAESRLPKAEATLLSAVPLSPVTEQQIASRLQLTDAARAADLAGVEHAPTSSRLVPEDLTRRARVYHVAVESYTDAALAEVLARVGDLEGFSVVARLAPGNAWIEHLRPVPNLTLIELPGVQYVWTEDITEIGVDGTFRMTARMSDRGFLLRRSLFVDRVRRYYPHLTPAELDALEKLPPGSDTHPGLLPDEVERPFPDIIFMNQGLVEADRAQPVTAAISQARGAPMRESMMYLEGGNVLLGTLPSGEPYALVGRDSAAIARAVLAHHSGRPVSETEVRTAMAKDLGVDPARVFLVEQPGVFHIDMAMTLLRPGTVLLNDAMEALGLQTQWLREDYEA